MVCLAMVEFDGAAAQLGGCAVSARGKVALERNRAPCLGERVWRDTLWWCTARRCGRAKLVGAGL